MSRKADGNLISKVRTCIMPPRRFESSKKYWRIVPFAAIALAMPALAQMDMSSDLVKRLEEPMPYMPAVLGPFTHAISSKNAEAQALFDQGFQMRYAFGRSEAIRSFREAWKRDPDCAICFWGEAYAWGSDLNWLMSKDDAPHAYHAMQNALRLRDKATPAEQAYIDALAVRYVQNFDPENTKIQDEAYAEAMRALAARFPNDLDAQTLFGEALLLTFPQRATLSLDDPRVQQIVAAFERVLANDIRHPGACHLYIHTTESTEPQRAEACAQFLGQSIPGASHINHMPSHTWNQLGRWGDSVRANLEAWHNDQKAAAGSLDGVAIYPPHNLGMLTFAASYDGQGAIAVQAARDQQRFGGTRTSEILALIRFGRFDDVLAITQRTEGPDGPFWDFAHGYARLKKGEADLARVYADRLDKAAEAETTEEPYFPLKSLLTLLASILRGELELSAGHTRIAIASFEKAVEKEDGFPYSEPEFLPFSARHWLGAALLEAKRPEEAERVYRDDLEHHPHNGWALFGLKSALEAQGTLADDVAADLAQSWARSDTWLRGSRF
jgi:tetratricopeptide (TPR) repeat protein